MKMVSDIGRRQHLIYEAFGTEPQYSDPPYAHTHNMGRQIFVIASPGVGVQR